MDTLLDSGWTLFWIWLTGLGLLDLAYWTWLTGLWMDTLWTSVTHLVLVLGLWVFGSWSWMLVDGSVVVVTLLVPGLWTLDSGLGYSFGFILARHTLWGTQAMGTLAQQQKNEGLGELARQFNMTLFWQLGWSPVGWGRWRKKEKGLPNKKN